MPAFRVIKYWYFHGVLADGVLHELLTFYTQVTDPWFKECQLATLLIPAARNGMEFILNFTFTFMSHLLSSTHMLMVIRFICHCVTRSDFSCEHFQ